MQIKANTVTEYIQQVPEHQREAILKLQNVILKHLPEGFEEVLSYGMIGYVVPLKRYPPGYRTKPIQPLPLINLAAQKNYVALYHMGIYSIEPLLKWFVDAYPNHTTAKLDMGKGCIRFKNLDLIPYDLIGQLAEKVTVEEWITIYEAFRPSK